MTTAQRSRLAWFVAAALVLLSLIPVLAGTARVAELSAGPQLTPENARFVTSPFPVIAHVVGATLFTMLGAFQFVPALRRRRWHRLVGRVLAPAGLVAALSGLWMAAFTRLPDHDGPLLLVFRLVFGVLMVAAIVLALVAVRRRRFAAHGAWMTRAYALGAGAGTQAVVLAVWSTAVGEPDATVRAVLMGGAWALNLGVAELANLRRAGRGARMRRAPGRADASINTSFS